MTEPPGPFEEGESASLAGSPVPRPLGAGRCLCSFLIIKQKRMIKLSLKGPPTLLKSAGLRFLVSSGGV